VLGFVEKRLEHEAAQGASSERLDSLLSQAKSGVEKGFDQAREQIGQLGLLNDDLSSEIEESESLIHTGLDKFETKYLQGDIERPSNTAASKPSADSDTVQDSPIATSSRYSQLNARADHTAIQIETQDGDIISINLSQLEASFRGGEFNSRSNHHHSTTYSAQYEGFYASEQYGFSIEGELDEGEIKALTDLMTQIEALSQQFFNGDFQGAFENALNIGFDASEIAAYSLDMTTIQVEQISTYEQVSQLGEHQPHTNQFKPLADFANDLVSAHQAALEHFQNVDKLMISLLDKVTEGPFSETANIQLNAPLQAGLKDYLSALMEQI